MPTVPEWDRGINAGIQEVTRHLDALRRQKINDRVVRGYAAGIGAGLMRWCLARMGPQLTYDLFSGLADEAIEGELPKGK